MKTFKIEKKVVFIYSSTKINKPSTNPTFTTITVTVTGVLQ
ncbi:hypothetical protein SAMN05421827_1405 [Pedobacter terrae]|uniref:Uncharacterized protein n=1 Tax=Pedobacter terrae TaxID=405671 RepID=A0A1G8EJZ4_9SPHI|nr:hypothetical protein SAMN05421827_1405 [Pedobacter terrae]